MGDSDFKTWALVIILGFGGLWQISKSLSPGQPMREIDVAAAAADREFEPYSVASGPSRPAAPGAIRHAPAHVTAGDDAQLVKFLATQATATETKDTAAPKKTEEKCEPKLDKTTGKMIPCPTKKKKKKKKANEAKHEELTNPLPKTAAKATDADARGIDWNVGAAIQTGRVNAVNTKPDQAFETLEAWQARLLGSPNLAETKVFIDHYQRNLVTSDVFYKITQQMLDDSRSDMKLLGVMCAGVTTSLTSFQVLAQFIAKQSTGTAPRTQADAALARYTDLGSLAILASVLRNNSNESATILAAQKLDLAAKNYLVTTSTAATQPTTGAPTTPAATPAATTTTKNRQYFTRFVSILTTLSKVSDAQVRDQATRSLANLNGLLGTEVAAPTAPTNPAANTTT